MTEERYERAAPGKLLGVCARAARDMAISPTPLRILAVVALLLAFKLTVVAYCVAALIYRLERR